MAESVDTSHQTYIPERFQAIRRAYLKEINITLTVPESLLHSFAHVRSQTARKDHATAIMTEENKAIDTLFDQSPGYGTLESVALLWQCFHADFVQSPSVFASAFDRHKWFMEREKYKSRLQKRMTDHMTKLAVSPAEWDEFGPREFSLTWRIHSSPDVSPKQPCRNGRQPSILVLEMMRPKSRTRKLHCLSLSTSLRRLISRKILSVHLLPA